MSIKNIIAGGPVAILATGGGVMWAQHEVHYLLSPHVLESLGGVACVGGLMAWSAMSKRKTKTPQVQQPVQPVQRPAEDIVTAWSAPVAGLPRGTSGDHIDVAYQRLVTDARTR